MSGVVDAVGKVFKKVRGFVEKVWDNKILRGIIIAAAVVYTAGVVANGSWSSWWASGTTTSAATSGAVTFTNAAGSTVTTGAGIAGAGSGLAPATALAPAAPGAAISAAASAAPVVGTGSTLQAGINASGAVEAAGAAPSLAGEFASSYTAGPAAEVAGSSGGIISGWMADNPMATMMIGSGVSNASAAREQRKAQEDANAHELAMKANEGAYGFNNMGVYNAPAYSTTPGSTPGIIASQQSTSMAAPTVSAPTIRPVKRNDLTNLHSQGLIAGQPIQLRGSNYG